jgi:DNA-directed RNA polymerase specialized sigma24 family protein
VDASVGVRPLDPSAGWALALRGDAATRAEALVRLRAHLAVAAKFELGRRGIAVDDGQRWEGASPVQDVVEAALAAILADLDRFRGHSRFTTWTAKYAIREAAAAAREMAIAASPDGRGERP